MVGSIPEVRSNRAEKLDSAYEGLPCQMGMISMPKSSLKM